MRVYRGSRQQEYPVAIISEAHLPQLLPIKSYPYERVQAVPESELIAWWRNHDAAIRLAASLLSDATDGGIDPYTCEVSVMPQLAHVYATQVEPVQTYVARAFAYEVITTWTEPTFTISQRDIQHWLTTKGVVLPQS